MTILPAGTFRVRDYRKAIPDRVKRDVLKRYEFDHDPALVNRPYDVEAGDFIPPQHDPASIFVREEASHDEKTFGRKADAAKTVTTRGSDVGEAARTREIRRTVAAHHARMDAKQTGEPQPERRKYSWPKRKLQSGNNLRRRP